jgi:glycosyltransferase involved in cell wall biosynthesis
VIHGLWQYHSYGSYRVVRGRTPYVVFPHGMLDPWFKRTFPLKHLKKQVYWLAREYRVLRDARAVCFTTPIERDDATKTLWPQRWNPAVVSFGTSAPPGNGARQREAFLARYPGLRQRRFFLFLSRIHRKKGCDLLLEALSRLAAAHPDLDLVMAGPDEEGLRPDLETQARRLHIEHRVHWTGMLEGDLKWGAFHAAEAFVLPSHQENFGVAVVEALACGVPVLISDKVNIWPDLAHDEAGIVNPDTADGTYRSMETLLAMRPEERQRMVSNGQACFRARYEMKRTAQALNDLF